MQRPSRLETLYDAHAAGVFHYLNGIVKSEADAKDLLQEFFIKLAARELPPLENERAYLLRIAHRMAIDWLRRHGARERAESAHPQAVFATSQEPAPPKPSRQVRNSGH